MPLQIFFGGICKELQIHLNYTTFALLIQHLFRFQILLLKLPEPLRLVQPEELRPVLHGLQLVRVQHPLRPCQRDAAAVAVLFGAPECAGVLRFLAVYLERLADFANLPVKDAVIRARVAVQHCIPLLDDLAALTLGGVACVFARLSGMPEEICT